MMSRLEAMMSRLEAMMSHLVSVGSILVPALLFAQFHAALFHMLCFFYKQPRSFCNHDACANA